MGKLYDAKCAIDRIIEENRMDPAAMRGSISMKAGFLLSLVNPATPDDPSKLAKLRTIAQEVLKRPI